jgi:hypothetical protein
MKTFYLLVDPERDDSWGEHAKRNNRNLGVQHPMTEDCVRLFHAYTCAKDVLKRRCKKLLVKSVL